MRPCTRVHTAAGSSAGSSELTRPSSRRMRTTDAHQFTSQISTSEVFPSDCKCSLDREIEKGRSVIKHDSSTSPEGISKYGAALKSAEGSFPMWWCRSLAQEIQRRELRLEYSFGYSQHTLDPVKMSFSNRSPIMLPILAGSRKNTPEPNIQRICFPTIDSAPPSRSDHNADVVKRDIYGFSPPQVVTLSI